MHLPVTPIDSLRILEEMSDKAKEEFSLDQFSEAETDEEFGLPEFKEHFADTLTPAVLRDWTAKDFASIYVRFRPHLERHARRFLVNPSQVEEVVQDAFLYLMTTLPELDSELGVLKFLKWKVRLLCLDVIRLESRRPQTSLEYIGDIADSSSDASESLERADDAAIVAMALAKLPPRQREALLVTLHQGKTNEEASRTMGLTPNAFRQLIFRARASFKRELIGEVEAIGLTLPELLSLAAKKAAANSGRTATLLAALFLSVAAAGPLLMPNTAPEVVISEPRMSVQDPNAPPPDFQIGLEVPQFEKTLEGQEQILKVLEGVRESFPLITDARVSEVLRLESDSTTTETEIAPVSYPNRPVDIAGTASVEEDQLLRDMLEEDVEITAMTTADPESTSQYDLDDDKLLLSVVLSSSVRFSIAIGEAMTDPNASFAMIGMTLPSGHEVSGVPQTTAISYGSEADGSQILEVGLTDFVLGDFGGAYGYVSSAETSVADWKILVRFSLGQDGTVESARARLIV